MAIYERVRTLKEAAGDLPDRAEAAVEALPPDEREILEEYRREKNTKTAEASHSAASA